MTIEDATVTTHVVASRTGPLRVAVVVPPRAGDAAFVVTLGHAASLEPFELQRFRLMALELAARLVVVETPGYGLPGSSLTAGERWSLLTRARFDRVASRMLDAALAVVPDLLGPDGADVEHLGIIGYSLGASIGSSVAAEIRRRTGRPVARLVLVEPVAGQRWRVRPLLAATRAEDALVDVALAGNEEVPGTVVPWDRRDDDRPAPARNELDLALLANALRAGRLGATVADDALPLRLDLVRGRGSLLSLAGACASITGRAEGSGIPSRTLVLDGSHALWHSLASISELCAFVLGGDDR